MNSLGSSSIGRVIRCASCQQENPAERKFCGQCGCALRQPCLDCGAINAVDEKFCGECGVNLSDAVQRQLDAARGKLEMAVKLEREGRFYDAQSVLQEISTSQDERLQALQENAQSLLQQLDKRRKQRTIDAQKLEAQARVYYRDQQHVKAFETLKSIPVGLSHAETVKFMVEVETFYQEITQLTAEIKQALKAKNYGGLIPKVERLCELQPDNQEARALGERLSNQRAADRSREATKLAGLAQKKLREHLYREAATAIARIAPEFLTGKVEQVYRTTKEVHWCSEELKRATLATKTLEQALLRWKKLIPSDPRPDKLAPQLKERLKANPKDPRFPVPGWMTSPQDTAIGYPLRFWSGLGHTQVETEARQQSREYPGQFLVAYGLALQGVGKGVLQHDLNPRRGGWGSLLTRKKADRVWGLDIGSTSIKAVEMVVDGEEVSVTQCLQFPHEQPLHAAHGADAVEAIVSDTVERFTDDVDVKKPRVAVGFSGRLGLARFFDLPPIKSKKTKLEDAVGFEVRHQIPIPMDEAIFDFHAWNAVGQGFVELRPIAAMAARKDDLQQWIAPVVQGGCEIALLQCDGFALYNAMHHDFLSRPDHEGAIVAIDVGGDVTNVVVGEKNFVWLRSIVHGVKRWDDALIRDLSVTKEQTEKLRKDPSLARHMHRVSESLDPDFTELREDISRSINGYPRSSETDIRCMLGTGGGCSQFGLMQNFIHGSAIAAAK